MDSEQKDTYAGFDRRIQVIALALMLAFGVLSLRLWDLQVSRGIEYRGKSDRNRLRIQPLEAPRGTIYGQLDGDQNVVLADNRPVHDLMFVPADCDIDPQLVCDRLERLLGIQASSLMEEIESAKANKQPHKQILIRLDVPASTSARIDEYAYALPGVFTVVRPMRRYAYGRTAGQLIGYLGEINPQELQARSERYRSGDLIGRSGIESLYEDTLHGRQGKMLVTRYAAGVPQIRTDPYGRPRVENLVDSYGHDLRVEEAILRPISGGDVFITLDIGAQAKAEELLEGEEGAIALLNADTGAVLALASSPGYDPSIFVSQRRTEERLEALRGKPNRMIHRAFQERYAPGSIFKIVLAIAALEEGVIDSASTHYCPGKFRITPNGRPWHCWMRSGHGKITVVDALAFSCDVFFYNVGLKLGVDNIHKWALRLGLGDLTGFDMPSETGGLIPSRQWKEDLLRPKHPNEPWEYRWYPGDTVNLSIGQGAASATPLQCAVLMSAIINGGRPVQPFLNRHSQISKSPQIFTEGTLAIVRRGMRKCVEKGPPAPTGTGHAAQIEGMTVIGKTASAQIVSLAQQEIYGDEENIPKAIRDHAWFIAGVLDREPPIALCILVEHGHHGSSAAAPLAKDMIEYFYSSRAASPARLARSSESPAL